MQGKAYRFDEIARIKVGTTFRKKLPYANTDISAIQIQDVNDGFINYNTVYTIEKPSSGKLYYLQDNDIILPARGRIKTPAIIHTQGRKLLATSQFLVITPNPDKVLPAFLYHTMSTVLFLEKLQVIQKGRSIKLISKSELSQLLFHIPPLALQENILTGIDQLNNLKAEISAIDSTISHLLLTLERPFTLSITQELAESCKLVRRASNKLNHTTTSSEILCPINPFGSLSITTPALETIN